MDSFLRWFHHTNRKVFIPLAICTGFSLLMALMQMKGVDAVVHMDSYQKNMNVVWGVRAKVDPRLFFLAIDKPNYRDDIGADEVGDSKVLATLRGDYPWPRPIYAALLDRLMAANVRLVIFDLLLLTPKDGDDELRVALDKYKDRVVIGCNFSPSEGQDSNRLSLMVPSPSLISRGEDGHARAELDPRVGFVNFWSEEVDGVMRRANFYMTPEIAMGLEPYGRPKSNPEVMYSLTGRAIQNLKMEDRLPDSWNSQIFRYSGPPFVTFPAHSLYEIFMPSVWAANYRNGELLKDKIVLVGPKGDWSHDEHKTPYNGLMPGPEIHLNVLSAALTGDFLREPGPWVIFALIFSSGLLAFGESMWLRNPLHLFAAGFGTILLYWVLSYVFYNYLSLSIVTASSSLAFFGGMVLTFGYQFIQEQYERSRLRGVLDRYMSKDLVKDVLDNPNSYFNTVGGVRKPVSVLFSDVRGFTTISEGADPSDLVKQLNEYLGDMVRIVFQNNGTLDKFIGDAVMAVWGNVVSGGVEVDAARAVRAALEMRAGLVKLNADWRSRGVMELAFGIGINHGEVIVGNVGSDQKMEITVIGDAVNLASRLESLTKEYHLDLLIGEKVADLVGNDFYLQMADNVRVKGKFKPVRVYAVLGERGKEPHPEIDSFLGSYQEAMDLYQKGEFASALPLFQTAQQILHPNDLAKIFIERCTNLIANPPEEWDGVYVMTKK